VCLQEVDESAYQKYLNPIFSQNGYRSHHTTKEGTCVEGCATFVSTATFDVLHTVDISIRDVIEAQSSVSGSYLHTLFLHKPEVYEILTKNITTIAQISILSYKRNPCHFCLAVNTHLFYHPDAAYIRLLQIHEIVKQLEQIKAFILSCNGQENAKSKLHRYFNSLLTSNCPDESFENQVGSSEQQHESDGYEKELSECVVGGVEESGLRSDVPFEVSCFVFGDLNSTADSGAIEYLER
jgi:mRNA deadenylase 3'-5' endonuclease subunit Ccr4